MNDLLPDQIHLWHRVEAVLRETGWLYGYQEIRTPMLEKTSLFSQSIGDHTDIVEKEMYTFFDSSEENLSLRPEATASTVRACVQHGLLHNRQHRLWYMGPMFRRERPQKGRYRQFHQFGIEALGWAGPDIDSEIIRVAERIWRVLGIAELKLEINTLGSAESRADYRDALRKFLLNHINLLDDDSKRRLDRNPLRILDSKDAGTREVIENAPVMKDYLSKSECAHFETICNSLEQSRIKYYINNRLVRGLDYYTSTVFEWTTDQLGAQAAVCAGGRYDTLIEKRRGKDTPAIGFAIGMERLVELVRQLQGTEPKEQFHIYSIDTTENKGVSVQLAEILRDRGFKVLSHCGGGKLKNQLKRSDQSGAMVTLIRGQHESDSGVIQIKHMRDNTPQLNIPVEQVPSWCMENLQLTYSD